MQIVPVENESQLGQVRELFEEYWASFGFTPCFQNFGDEVAGLPGKYRPPSGRLAIAVIASATAGCVALRPVDADRCEAKRLYVRPRYRGFGAGRALMDWVMAEAREAGYRMMLGDTMPVMERALEMYWRMGFERTGPYTQEPTPGAIYFRLKL